MLKIDTLNIPDLRNTTTDKIQQNLVKLRDYLAKYEEHDAAKLIDVTRRNLPNIDVHAIIDEYKRQYIVLRSIDKNIKRIAEDLIDEQDTSLKYKDKKLHSGLLEQKVEKTKEPEGKETEQKTEGLFSRLKDKLFGAVGALLARSMLGKAFKIVRSLFGVGKLGFTLVAKTTKAVIAGALKVGGWLWKMLSTAIWAVMPDKLKRMLKAGKAAGSKIVNNAVKAAATAKSKIVTKTVDTAKNTKNAIHTTSAKILKNTTQTARKIANKSYSSIGKFFDKATNSIKNNKLLQTNVGSKIANGVSSTSKMLQNGASAIVTGASKIGTSTINAAKKLGSATASVVSNASNAVTAATAKKIAELRSVVTKHTSKLTSILSKSPSKAAIRVGAALPKALTKSLARLIPGVGWSLLAYDAYDSYKRSSSVTQFTVNLLDNLSAGLISLAVSANGENVPNGNLGIYVENLLGLSGSNADNATAQQMLNDVNLSNLSNSDATATADALTNSGLSTETLKILESTNLPDTIKQQIINKHFELRNLISNNTITHAAATQQFNDFVKNLLVNRNSTNTAVNRSAVYTQNRMIMNTETAVNKAQYYKTIGDAANLATQIASTAVNNASNVMNKMMQSSINIYNGSMQYTMVQ